MTCIVGLEYNNRVYIGADSAAALNWQVCPTTCQKVFRNDLLVIGYTDSFRMGQLLKYKLAVPPRSGKDIEEYLVCDVIESIRTCLKDGGFTTIENNEESSGTFLLGYLDRLYYVSPDMAITRPVSGMEACGCGRQFALGALAALRPTLEPRATLYKVLEITANFCGGVRPPFQVLSTREE